VAFFKTRATFRGVVREFRRNIQALPRLVGWRDGLSLHPLQIRQIQEAASRIDSPVTVLEFGSGVSTGVLAHMFSSLGTTHQIVSYDHSRKWAFRGDLELEHVDVRIRPLVSWSDEEFERLFTVGYDLKTARRLTAVESEDFRISCGFYEIDPEEIPEKIDFVLLDGPNGSGRGAAFPLLRTSLRPGSYVFIDDLNAYDFERALGRVFRYETVAKLTDTQVHPTFSFGLFRVLASAGESDRKPVPEDIHAYSAESK